MQTRIAWTNKKLYVDRLQKAPGIESHFESFFIAISALLNI